MKLNKLFHFLAFGAILASLFGCAETRPTMPIAIMQQKPAEVINAENKVSQPHYIAVLLPLSGKLAANGQAIRDGFLAAHHHAKQSGQSVTRIKIFDTGRRNIKSIYEQATAEGADFFVGPLTKNEVSELAAMRQSTIPVLALNTPDDYQKNTYENFYYFGLSPQDEVIQAAYKIRRDNHLRVLAIYPNNNWGGSLMKTFAYNFEHNGGEIVDQLAFDHKTDLLQQVGTLLQVNPELLQPKDNNAAPSPKIDPLTYRRQDFDAFFLIAKPEDARMVRPLLKFHFSGQIPVYATSMVYSGNPNPALDSDLNGIAFCDMPWILRDPLLLPAYIQIPKLQLSANWQNASRQNIQLYALGIDSYNAIRFLNKPNAFPKNGLSGATGILFLDNYHHIYRNLDWAKFKGGKPSSI